MIIKAGPALFIASEHIAWVYHEGTSLTVNMVGGQRVLLFDEWATRFREYLERIAGLNLCDPGGIERCFSKPVGGPVCEATTCCGDCEPVDCPAGSPDPVTEVAGGIQGVSNAIEAECV